MNAPHTPVMLDEVLDALSPLDGQVIVDATFGAGGYSRALLAAGAIVHAFDRDDHAVADAAAVVAEAGGRLVLHHARFSELASVLRTAGVRAVDGVVFDIGVSSMQIDRPERGFSFQADGPLDMRMGGEGPTAADLCNELEEGALADVLYQFGGERASRRIARAIVATRPLSRTGELAAVVRRALHAKGHEPRDPATRTFQALRIAVNDELGELVSGLAAAEAMLADGGRLVVVAFHSGEDRIVKRFLRDRSGANARPSRHAPAAAPPTESMAAAATFRDVRGPVRAGEREVAANPRARSAVLRSAIRAVAA